MAKATTDGSTDHTKNVERTDGSRRRQPVIDILTETDRNKNRREAKPTETDRYNDGWRDRLTILVRRNDRWKAWPNSTDQHGLTV